MNKDKHMKVTTHHNDDDDDDGDDDNDDDFDDETESNDTHLRRKRKRVKKTDPLLQDGEWTRYRIDNQSVHEKVYHDMVLHYEEMKKRENIII